MSLLDRFLRPKPVTPPAADLSEAELKKRAAEASFIVVEFAAQGSSVFRIQEQNVTAWQIAALAKTLEVKAERLMWDWENENRERAKARHIAVPGRTH